MNKLSIIIPCYYNEDNIEITFSKIEDVTKNISSKWEIEYILVDDYSKDNTWRKITSLKNIFPTKIKAIKLKENIGSYNAIIQGLKFATGDANVVISADLQDPPTLILDMLNEWENGYKLVIANRNERNDSQLDNLFASIYHKTIKTLAISNLPKGGFDYVLFDKTLKNNLLKLNPIDTNSLYLLLTLKTEYKLISYSRNKREIGKSRWTLKKKINLFYDSILSLAPNNVKIFANILIILTVGIFIVAENFTLIKVIAIIFGLLGVAIHFAIILRNKRIQKKKSLYLNNIIECQLL